MTLVCAVSPTSGAGGGGGAGATDEPVSTASSDLSTSGGGGGTDKAPGGLNQPHLQQQSREEPEVIKQWKTRQVALLEQKDADEEEAKLDLRQQAKKELEAWYKQHTEQVCFT